MPSPMPARLSGIRRKIARANEHIINLDAALAAFYESNPYKVATNRDVETRRLLYYVASVESTPPFISLIAGDAVHNLRSALDQLAFQLFRAGGAVGPGKHVYFPIIDDPIKNKSTFDGQVKGLGQRSVEAIKAIEAHKGGKGHQLWVLHQLDRIDKHRELLTVGSAFRSFNLGAWGWDAIAEGWERMTGKKFVVPVLDLYLRPADRLCPLKAGDKLFGRNRSSARHKS